MAKKPTVHYAILESATNTIYRRACLYPWGAHGKAFHEWQIRLKGNNTTKDKSHVICGNCKRTNAFKGK